MHVELLPSLATGFAGLRGDEIIPQSGAVERQRGSSLQLGLRRDIVGDEEENDAAMDDSRSQGWIRHRHMEQLTRSEQLRQADVPRLICDHTLTHADGKARQRQAPRKPAFVVPAASGFIILQPLSSIVRIGGETTRIAHGERLPPQEVDSAFAECAYGHYPAESGEERVRHGALWSYLSVPGTNVIVQKLEHVSAFLARTWKLNVRTRYKPAPGVARYRWYLG